MTIGQRSLRTNEEQLGRLLGFASDAVAVVNNAGRIVWANSQMDQLFSYEGGKLLNQPIETLLSSGAPEQEESWDHYFMGWSSPPVVTALELQGKRRDGTHFPAEISLSPIETDDGMFVCTTIRDITDRKRAEASRLHFAAIVESSEDAIISKTLDGIVLTWNAAAERLYGYAPHEIVGQPVTLLIPAGRDDEEPAILERIRRGDRIEHYETVRQRKDGTLIDVSLTISPIKDANGRIISVSKIARDITDRKRVEAALQERARIAHLRADISAALIVDQSLTSVLQQCAEAIVAHLDAAMARIWTVNGAEETLQLHASAGMSLTGQQGSSRRADSTIGEIARTAQPLVINRGPEGPSISEPNRLPGKGLVAFAGYPMVMDGGVVGVVEVFARQALTYPVLEELASIAHGIGQWLSRKHAEQTIREKEERLNLATEAAELGIWEWHVAEDRALWENDRCYAIFGRTRADGTISAAEFTSDIVHPDDTVAFNEAMAKTLGTGARFFFQGRIYRKDRTLGWVELTGQLERGPDGAPRRMIGTLLDITERKCAEKKLLESEERYRDQAQALRQKQEQLVQAAKLASLGELATGVAHEINNPLNNIGLVLGNLLERLQSGQLKVETLPEKINAVLGQVQKAACIVDHLRTFGRQVSGPDGSVSVNEVIRSAVSLTEQQFLHENIALSIELSERNPTVLGNAIHLEQVIINLLTNARDAVQDAPQKTVYVRSALRGSQVVLSVRDTGCGIPKDLHARIFDPFFTTKEVGKGTGLGLSVSYGIIRDLGGTIQADSSLGQGATFTVALPAAPEFLPASGS